MTEHDHGDALLPIRCGATREVEAKEAGIKGEALRRIRTFLELDGTEFLETESDEEKRQNKYDRRPWQRLACSMLGLNDAVVALQRRRVLEGKGKTIDKSWDTIDSATGTPTMVAIFSSLEPTHRGELIQLYYGYDPKESPSPPGRNRLEARLPTNRYLDEFVGGTLQGSHAFDCSAGGDHESGEFRVAYPFMSQKAEDVFSYVTTTQHLLRLLMLELSDDSDTVANAL